jgi:hypothetical protein
MNHYTADDIYVPNAYYLQYQSQTESHYAFVITFLHYRGLVQDYLHYLDTGELPLQVSIDESSKDYLHDTYNYSGCGRMINEYLYLYTPDNNYEESHLKYISLT